MKKIALLLFFLTSFNLLAQETTFGLRLGINASKFKVEDEDYYDYDKPIAIGRPNIFMLLNIPVTENFSFQPEFGIIQKGIQSKYKDDGYSATYKQLFTYLELPILGVYTMEVAPKLQASAFLGPGLGFAVGGKAKSVENDYGDIYKEEIKVNFKNDYVNRVDISLIIGGSVLYEIGPGKAVFDLRFQPSFTNINKDPDDYFVKNRSFSVSVGYILPISGVK